ncbi:MAG: TIGR03757 family integrating conjugative element protein, partial [Saezia sp.]
QNLPDDPEEAAQMARQRLEEGTQSMQQAMRGILQDVVDVWSLGVFKVPAVIVDQRYVVYGESDVNQAIFKIKRYQEQK